ncbi:uncharacterized protein LTR77_004035 [Saxophila tyrrhenica]|uniref:Enoyl reductase (ER) domain-containing protein n=1 Tax=Saxophila tyrrhenica TaxID=1690608 RepID=A0AAV9PBL6_9PEZI|nr:hypothetical protein LTR77_004035 [Saxophila tyrrhenica]
MANSSAYLDAIGKPLRVGEAEIPQPGKHDIVVKNRAIALNPADHMQANTNFMNFPYPIVLGSDVAGHVHSVGTQVTRFQPGDRVAGFAQWLIRGTPEDGAFSLYTRLPAGNAARIPESVSFNEGAVLGMAIGTAVSGLNGEGHLGLLFPTLNTESDGRVLVVYGGSSSIGSMAIQLAAAAGLRVVSISSAKNFDMCRRCGASSTFDYTSASVVDDVVAAVGKDPCVGIFESISSEDSFKTSLAILEKLGGGRMACSLPPPKELSDHIKATWMVATGEHSIPVFEDFVTQALESGRLKCLPEPLVVGKGLESLQKALEVLQAGMSARKVVVEL